MAGSFGTRAKELGLEIRTFSETTRTSQDAASAIGCKVGQIGKSVIFNFKLPILNDKFKTWPVLVIASGKNRVDAGGLGKLIGGQIEKADADFVYNVTGYPIGGVPPFGHKTAIQHIFMDSDLLQYNTIWCAAGTPYSVFEINPRRLVEITGAEVVDLKIYE